LKGKYFLVEMRKTEIVQRISEKFNIQQILMIMEIYGVQKPKDLNLSVFQLANLLTKDLSYATAIDIMDMPLNDGEELSQRILSFKEYSS
jgi:hypothetical protein